MQNELYIGLLITTLKKKKKLLEHIYSLCKEQQVFALQKQHKDFEPFDHCMEEKEAAIRKLNELDEGFEQLYRKVKEELKSNRLDYKSYIMDLQQLIRQVTEVGIQIEVIEKRNKEKIETLFDSKRQEIKAFHQNKQAMNHYYNHMLRHQQGDSYFLDRKK